MKSTVWHYCFLCNRSHKLRVYWGLPVSFPSWDIKDTNLHQQVYWQMFKQLASQKSMNLQAETGVSRLSSACIGGRGGQTCLWKTGYFHRPLERDPLQNRHLSDTLQFSKTKFLFCLRTQAGQVSTKEIFYDPGEHWSTSFGRPGWAFSLSGKAWIMSLT